MGVTLALVDHTNCNIQPVLRQWALSVGIIHIIKHYTGIILLYECYECLMVEQVKKCSCSFFSPLALLSLSTLQGKKGEVGSVGGMMVFQGRIFVLFLLTVPRMRNRYCYFKISPYLNLLLPFSPSPRLICRSVAKGFSLMTLLGRRSESRHISRFQFPFSLSLHFYLSLSLSLPSTSSHLPPLLLLYVTPPPPPKKQHHSSAGAA